MCILITRYFAVDTHQHATQVYIVCDLFRPAPAPFFGGGKYLDLVWDRFAVETGFTFGRYQTNLAGKI